MSAGSAGTVCKAPFPWDREQKLRDFLKPQSRVLAFSEADAALVRQMGHPASLTAVLSPAEGERREGFDLAVAFFAPYTLETVRTSLRVGGYFLTEQPSSPSGAAIRGALGGEGALPDGFCLENERERFLAAGFSVNFCDQAFVPVRFGDENALSVYLRENARIFGTLSAEPERAAHALFSGGQSPLDTEGRFLLIVRRRQ